MAIERVLSVNVFVGSPASNHRFYGDGLALQSGRSNEQLAAYCPTGTSLNLLPAVGDDQALIGRQTGITLYMRGEGDLVRLVDRLKEMNMTIDGPGVHTWRDGQRCHVRDASGNRLTLMESFGDEHDLHLFDGPGQVTIAVRDLYRALDFYVAGLELPMLSQPDPNTAILFNDGTQLVLAQKPSWTAAPPVHGETGLCLYMDDTGYMLDMFQGKGIRLPETPRVAGDLTFAMVVDPDGNRLTLMGPSA